MAATILNVAGLWNSGPHHWQTLWEASLPNCSRIEQEDWESPKQKDWVINIEFAVSHASAPVVLVGHSLGCIAIAYWAQQTRRHIAGALLVAPSDVEREGYPAGATGFRPLPTRKLPFPSILVASEDDPWLTMERAEFMAKNWKSQLVKIGKAGHINSDSGLRDWPAGQKLLQSLVDAAN